MSYARELWVSNRELYKRKWELIGRKPCLSPLELRELIRVDKEYESNWKEVLKEEKRNPTIRVFGKHKDQWELLPEKDK